MPRMIKTTVTGVLIELLRKYGVRNIFGLPSGQLGIFMDGVSRDPFFRYITTRHEECAGHMAHGATIAGDEMALSFATVGPGATNLLPGVAAAWADNIPMIVLTANNPLKMLDPYADMLQAVDQIALFKPVTKWNVQIRDPERAGALMERAIGLARSGRPGPVHIDLPVDVSTMACTYDLDRLPVVQPPRPRPSGSELDALLAMLASAQRPLLVAGGGVIRSGAVDVFRAVSARLGIPAISSVQGWGAVDPRSDLYIGSPGWHAGFAALQAGREADLVLAIGCKFGSWTPVAKPPAVTPVAGQRIVQVDIDETMLGKNAAIALGLVGDARETLEALLARLDGIAMDVDRAWIDSLLAARGDYVAALDGLANETAGAQPPGTPAFMREIRRLLPENAIVCVDGGQTSSWAMSFLEAAGPYAAKFESGMGHMGCGLPMAIGAKVAQAEDRPVFVVCGDGSAGLTGQELETASRLGIKLVMIVMNDSCWGCYKPLEQFVFQNDRLGPSMVDTDFSRVAMAYGCKGERITRVEELEGAIARAMASPVTALIDIPVSFAPHPLDGEFFVKTIMPGAELQPHRVEQL
ncbi:thiamine pyrophosphate-binding protein [Sphingomonas sp. Root720]|uniref:thiamine pyrophosphate-binding protein n=2 Tax=Sphingomonas TaxID=13687 RepID=UPI000A69ED69|nr:thiamine pyrophosphate-binding protein [Sphingomonas sp. Root720]